MIEELMQSRFHAARIQLETRVMYWDIYEQRWKVNCLRDKVTLYCGESLEEALKKLTQ